MEYFNGIQDFYLSLGQEGCLALCLIGIAQDKGCKKDVIECIKEGIEKGFLSFNKNNFLDPENFTVKDSLGYVKHLTKKQCALEIFTHKECPTHQREFVIYKWIWNNPTTGKKQVHFTRELSDPKQNSNTVRNGRIAETRIFTFFDFEE